MVPVLLVFSDWALFFLRLLVGLIFLSRGWQNLENLSAGGGSFFEGKKNSGNFAGIDSKFAKILGAVLILAEIIGGLFIILGIYTQIAALFFALEMAAVAVWKIMKGHEFSGGPACAGGYEFELLLVAANLILVTMGGGFFALVF